MKILRYFLAVLGLLVIIGLLGGIKGVQIASLINFGKEMEKAGPPPETVSTAVAKQERWEGTIHAVGSAVSVKGVSLTNEVAGVVTRLHFESGKSVRKGQVLVELDTQVERAQLASTKARRELAEVSFNRSKGLVKSGAIAQSQFDTDESAFKGVVADEQGLLAQIDRKIIRAPFAGKLGIRMVNLGQYLAPGTTIAVLESTKSLFVDFSLPQQYLGGLKLGMSVRASPEGNDSSVEEGVITAIDPTVDTVTRTVKVRATLPNEQDRLRSGMFLNVEVLLPQQAPAVAVPLTAVVRAPYGDSLFIVEDKPKGKEAKSNTAKADAQAPKIARQQFVRLGEERGDFVTILEGLKPGQEVVSGGAFKLRNGSPIVINNKVKPQPQLDPKLDNR